LERGDIHCMSILAKTKNTQLKLILERKMIHVRLVATTLYYVVVVLGELPLFSNAQLDPYFYGETCPRLHFIVQKVAWKASLIDPRIFAILVSRGGA